MRSFINSKLILRCVIFVFSCAGARCHHSYRHRRVPRSFCSSRSHRDHAQKVHCLLRRDIYVFISSLSQSHLFYSPLNCVFKCLIGGRSFVKWMHFTETCFVISFSYKTQDRETQAKTEQKGNCSQEKFWLHLFGDHTINIDILL